MSLPAFGQIQQDVNKTSGTESNPITEIDSIRFDPGQTQMQIILNNGSAIIHTISDIDNVTFSGQLNGEVDNLDCASATINGSLVEGVAASGVSADIDYTGGNGGPHNGQTVNSTGVTGLTAELTAGNFANGAGTLTYNITGTPNSSGTASFAIQIGGMPCTLEISVGGGIVSTLDCASATINGSLVEGVAASGVAADIAYTGGNGGPHNGQTVNSTGVTGLTAELTAGNFANGAGTLNYNITGMPSSSGTASFAINIGGMNCTLEITVDGGTISTLDCASATINGSLVEGVAADIDYTGGNDGPHNGQTVNSTGVTGLTAELTAGNFATGAGTLTYNITGTPNSSGTASFAINIGGMSCTLEITVDGGAISTLDCSGATINGTLEEGAAASGVSADIDYTGGNGGPHNGQTVNSTGVTGLTAELTAGNFANGAGTLTYNITGTSNSSGTASFAINIGGMSCTLEVTVDAAGPTYPPGTVHCTGTPTAIVDVTNPTTGATWMDRNLGASQVATSYNDPDAYGDYYQWGRLADGHQCTNSTVISTLSSSDQPGHGDFIVLGTGLYDWRDPQNVNLWQGVNGVNNPCPSGYRVPTSAELNSERISWSSSNRAGAFDSPLKFSTGGGRTGNNIPSIGNIGYYWSSTVNSTESNALYFDGSNAAIYPYGRRNGLLVRCLKD